MSRPSESPWKISLLRRFLLLALLAPSGCASTLPPQSSSALSAEDIRLTRQIEIQGRDRLGQPGSHFLSASENVFIARAALIHVAQHSLDIQYYIIYDGLTMCVPAYELLKVADRGVQARTLIGDTASDGWDYEIGVLSAHPNIQVRLFNPLHPGCTAGITRGVDHLFNLSQQHRCMHNKLWLVDGTAAIVGGHNLGDEYFSAKPEMNSIDLDLLGVGPIASQLSHSLGQYWNNATSQPTENFLWRASYPGELESARRRSQRYLCKGSVKKSGYIRHLFNRGDQPRLGNRLENLTWVRTGAIWDAPLRVLGRGEPDPHLLLSPHLAGPFKGVQKELILVSAHFVPAEDGLNYLTGRANSGVRMRLLTNSLEATDAPAVHVGYAPHRMVLLEHGVKLYELHANPDQPLSGAPWRPHGSSSASLYSKATVFDRRRVFTDSFNFDPHSILWNTEVRVIVDSPLLAEQVRQLALEDTAPSVGHQVRIDCSGSWPKLVWIDECDGRTQILRHELGSLWRRLNAWVVGTIGLEKIL